VFRLLFRLGLFGSLASLAACGGGGAPVNATPAPTVSLTASPTSIDFGGASLLTWVSTNATACQASGSWSGTLAASGTQNTGVLTGSASFSLTCTGPSGTSQPASVTVIVNSVMPTVQITANPSVIAAGGTTTLTWSSTDATSCTASGAWSGTQAVGGSLATGPLSQATTYALSCTGPSGTTQASAVVNIDPTASLTVSPTVIAPGQTATLSWTSTNASACAASNGWGGVLTSSGSQMTVALNATTTFSLACSGPGGVSALTSVTVTVSSVIMSVAPQTAPLTLGRTQQFTATVPGDAAAVWSVDGIPNGNSSVGTITANGLYSAGTAGTHSIVATSVANATQSATAVAAVTDLSGVFTYHNDQSRDGANVQEYALAPANVTAGKFGKVASCAVDGAIYGQPLWVANVTLGGKRHNVVFVTTQHDSLFAFDADATVCTLLWSASMVDAAHGAGAGETSVPSTAVGVGTGDIVPEVGISGTPVIDPATGTLYVVAKSIDPTLTNYFQRLHAIDITSGMERAGSPVVIGGSYPGTGSGSSTVAFNIKQENQRAGLALAHGVVYIAWGSHEDSVPWYGWMMGYQYNGSGWTQTAMFNAAPNSQRAGIWMGGGAPPVDSSNQLYVTTGNGNFNASNLATPNNDYGDSLLQLSSALQVNQYFTPTDQMNDFTADRDFGSGGAATLGDLPMGNTITHVLVCGGKDGTLYVINRDLLGGLGDSAAIQTLSLGGANFSTPTLWNNNLFAAGTSGQVHAWQLNPSTAQFTLGTKSNHAFGFPGATLSVSSAASQNGVVWAIDSHSYCTRQSSSCGPAVLYALDAANLAHQLWSSADNPADTAGNAVKFTVPTVANGRVFVGTRGNNAGGADSSTSAPGELEFYGLLP
jgi:hypothetical protein